MTHNKDGFSLVSPDGWTDVGCADLAAAKRNRQRIKQQENISGYLEIERWLQTHKGQVPAEFLGELPQVGKHDNVPEYMHEEVN